LPLLINPAAASSNETTVQSVQDAARILGLQVQVLNASSSTEIDAAFATLVRERPDALFVAPDAFFNSRRGQFATLAEYVEAGGLMSYGANISEQYRQLGNYAGRILSGQKPGDLSVTRARRLEFVINLKTAKTLGLTIPQTLLATADEVIQ
jgi:putative ABC transport system substrate-binding protein